jgi:predicted naringenin-chalcone synthase
MDVVAGEARIEAMANAVPTVRVTTEEISQAMGRLRGRRLHTPAAGHAGIRYFAQPLASVMVPRGVSEQTDAYLRHARILARQVTCEVLERSGIDRDSVGLVIGVSCTG